MFGSPKTPKIEDRPVGALGRRGLLAGIIGVAATTALSRPAAAQMVPQDKIEDVARGIMQPLMDEMNANIMLGNNFAAKNPKEADAVNNMLVRNYLVAFRGDFNNLIYSLGGRNIGLENPVPLPDLTKETASDWLKNAEETVITVLKLKSRTQPVTQGDMGILTAEITPMWNAGKEFPKALMELEKRMAPLSVAPTPPSGSGSTVPKVTPSPLRPFIPFNAPAAPAAPKSGEFHAPRPSGMSL